MGIVEPHSCICPNQSYICRAYNVSGMSWSSAQTERIAYNKNDPSSLNVTKEGIQVLFSIDENARSISSQLFLEPFHFLNGENFTCRAFSDTISMETNVSTCIIGETSSYLQLGSVTSRDPYCFRSSHSSHWTVSGVGPTISCGQFPVSSVWWRMCGLLCGDCCQ